jgi:hypothetical protein
MFYAVNQTTGDVVHAFVTASGRDSYVAENPGYRKAVGTAHARRAMIDEIKAIRGVRFAGPCELDSYSMAELWVELTRARADR